jgi:S-methyl-5-thioribose-1-phosphate isomerase/methylthioribulose-1-phosphate dehydratase
LERTLAWDGAAVVAVDQCALPRERTVLRLTTPDEVIDAIKRLAIRGAPAIGVAGALAVALSAHLSDGDDRAVREDAERIANARPTAVNLSWAVRRVLTKLPGGARAVLDEALAMLEEDEQTNRAMAARAADAVLGLTSRRPLRIMTHCNTGSLATVAIGTALGGIKELAERGLVEEVLAGETRPLLQGARLTAWELTQAGIPFRLCVDSAGPAAIAAGLVDVVMVGADRITANGDVANKVGTYSLAVAAARSGIPFVVVAPESTVDESIADGSHIVIEQRHAEEVTAFGGHQVALPDTPVFNPAFDVTPNDLVTAIVTEQRLWPQRPAGQLAEVARGLYQRGWLDGTAGNLSVRLGEQALITASGRSKGELTAADVVLVEAETGERISGPKPSAETSIHAAIYRAFPDCGAVVHAHPPYATAVAAKAMAAGQDTVRFTDFEIIKGFGVADPSELAVPVFTNWSDVTRIADEVGKRLDGSVPVLLIGHHGVTAWGPTLEIARNRVECIEALCRLHLLTN